MYLLRRLELACPKYEAVVVVASRGDADERLLGVLSETGHAQTLDIRKGSGGAGRFGFRAGPNQASDADYVVRYLRQNFEFDVIYCDVVQRALSMINGTKDDAFSEAHELKDGQSQSQRF